METIIPKRRFVAQILEQLDTWVPDVDPDSVITSLAILDFAHRVITTMDAHFARYDLSQGRFTVLMFLFHFPGTAWTPASLADAAGVSRATMTGLLRRLERDEWIVRAPDPEDGRRSMIDLSDSGRVRVVEILPDHFGRFAKAMADVGPGEHDRARATLAAFGARIASVTGASPPPAAGAPDDD